MTITVIAIAVSGFAGGLCVGQGGRKLLWLGGLNLSLCAVNVWLALQ